MDFCINDRLHLFVAVSVLNIGLYFATCVRFDSTLSRLAFAMDFSLMSKLFMETAMGNAAWPQDAMSNAYVFVCFTAFFYIMAPNMWGTIFLIFGLLSVQSFWDSVRDQVESFLQHSLNYIVVVSDAKAVFAGVILFILVAVGFRMFFTIPLVQDISLAIVYGVKIWVAYKLLRIELGHGEQVCCAAGSDVELCPFWFNHRSEWLIMLTLGIVRLGLSRLVGTGCQSSSLPPQDYSAVLCVDPDHNLDIGDRIAVDGVVKAGTKKPPALHADGKPRFRIPQ